MASNSGGQRRRRRPQGIEIGVERTVESTVSESPYAPGWRGEVVTTCYSDRDPRYIARERGTDNGQAPATEEHSAMPTPSQDMPETSSGNRKRLSTSIGNLLVNLQMSPRKSEYGSATGVEPSLPVHAIRRSELSQQNPNRLRDERSARGIVEDRAEFRRTGKIPDFGNENDPIVITTEDLREQCREAAKKKEQQSDFPRSLSTKKLFNSIRNSFKASSDHAAPDMPDKAAQVFGMSEKHGRKTLSRQIVPARTMDTQLVDLQTAVPPTPPAKDTPPRADNASANPGTRLASAGQRATLKDKEGVLDKKGPHVSAETTALIEGTPLKRPVVRSEQTEHGDKTPAKDKAPAKDKGKQRMKLSSARPDAVKEEFLQPRFYSPPGHKARSFAPGESPSRNTDATRLLFAVPSQAHPSDSNDDLNDCSSKEGSIKVMFVGDPREIDRGSSTAKLIEEMERNKKASAHGRDDAVITPRVMQELRLEEPVAAGPTSSSTHPQANNPSSRLTDMLRDANPPSHGWNQDFKPNCPSAVPSPLVRISASPLAPRQPGMTSPAPAAVWLPQTHKTIEEHFFMTNEHLDVVGKTTWDILEMSQQQYLAAVEDKYDQAATMIEKRFEDAIAQLAATNDKANGSAEKIARMHDDLAKVLSCITTEMASAFQAQDKKTAALEERIKEMQTSMQAMQKLLEQKTKEFASGQLSSSSKALSPLSSGRSPYRGQDHRRQTAIANYYSQAAQASREGHAATHDNNNNNNNGSSSNSNSGASPQPAGPDGQGSHEDDNGRQWGARGLYPARGSSREAGRGGYVGTNPYQFAAGGPYGGYAGGYGGYSYLYPPTSSDTHQGPGSGQGN